MVKILLAEDDDLTRTTLGKFLRGSGYDVELAQDGTQAISLLNEHKFDLVLSDVVMPNGNGLNLLDHVGIVSPDTSRFCRHSRWRSAQEREKFRPKFMANTSCRIF